MNKKILVYGDSNTWGWIGVEEAFPSTRYNDDERWAGVMSDALGSDVSVAVDGLTVRSTNLDDSNDWNNITADMFNGAKLLPCAIAREMPLDLLIISLGTNDLKSETNRSAKDIAEALIGLSEISNQSASGVAYKYDAPKVLIIAPAPLNSMPHPDFAAMFEGAQKKSKNISFELKKAASGRDIFILDAGEIIGAAASVDGLHISKQQHNQLGIAVAKTVKSILK
ncbi:SGNH/GDSL hydrolase family protein [Pelagibaculum spongiae]|nr:GDSL-type esterase/lipase family protein [Pelagibaculum spongiae]